MNLFLATTFLHGLDGDSALAIIESYALFVNPSRRLYLVHFLVKSVCPVAFYGNYLFLPHRRTLHENAVPWSSIHTAFCLGREVFTSQPVVQHVNSVGRETAEILLHFCLPKTRAGADAGISARLAQHHGLNGLAPWLAEPMKQWKKLPRNCFPAEGEQL